VVARSAPSVGPGYRRGVKQRPFFADSIYRRHLCFRLAAVLAYAALTIVLAVIGAKFLLTLAAVVTVLFGYEVVRFCVAHRQFGA
jgi:uncharacterized membrane protein